MRVKYQTTTDKVRWTPFYFQRLTVRQETL